MRYISSVIMVIVFFGLAIMAQAQERKKTEPKTENTAQILRNIKPLSKKQVRELKNSMPDFNRIMSGMIQIGTNMASDKDMQNHLQNSAQIIEKKLMATMPKDKNQMPDINAIVGAMIELAGDEKLVEELKQGFEPMLEMADEMQELVSKNR